MDKASVIEFDDDISAFNGIVAVTTRDDRLPFHMVRVREDEEGPSATLSRGLISFAHTGQMSFSYAMKRRWRLIATARTRMKGLRTSTDGVRAAVRRPRRTIDATGSRSTRWPKALAGNSELEACTQFNHAVGRNVEEVGRRAGIARHEGEESLSPPHHRDGARRQ